MEHQPPGDRDALYRLLWMRIGEEIGYDEFRRRFEEIYTFQLDRTTLGIGEQQILETLFSIVTRYSPFSADRETYPGVYIDEGQFSAAVEQAKRALEN